MMHVFLLFCAVQARQHSVNEFEGLYMFIVNTAARIMDASTGLSSLGNTFIQLFLALFPREVCPPVPADRLHLVVLFPPHSFLQMSEFGHEGNADSQPPSSHI